VRDLLLVLGLGFFQGRGLFGSGSGFGGEGLGFGRWVAVLVGQVIILLLSSGRKKE
jgi:hypothetical protein